MNLEEGQVGVYKKHALIRENPHLEAESDKILYLNDLDNLLQYKFGKITKAGFQLAPYQRMAHSTPVYFLVTNGDDGSYIVDNFVSREVLPDLDMWKYTYASL